MILLSTVITSMEKELWAFFSTEAHPDMYRYINSAINYIFNRRDWQWNRSLYTLSYTTPWVEQTLPFFTAKVYRVKAWSEEYCVYNREEWFMNDTHSLAVWVFWDTFVSDSVGTYQILYSRTAPTVSSSDTTIDMPPFYIDALQAIAVHYAYKDIKDYSSASALIGQANAILDSVTERTTDVRPRNVVRLWSYHSF